MQKVRAWSLAWAAAWSAACLLTTACGTEPKPSPPGQGGTACTLSQSGHSTSDEWGSCVQVTATLNRPPRVGEEAVLTVEVLAVTDRPVRVELDLPRSFAWVAVPAGLEQTQLADRAPDNGGCLHRASGAMTLTGGKASLLTGTVKATATGFATLRTRAISTASPNIAGETGADNVYVTVRQSPHASEFGYHGGTEAGAVTTAGSVPAACE